MKRIKKMKSRKKRMQMQKLAAIITAITLVFSALPIQSYAAVDSHSVQWFWELYTY